MSQYDKRSDVTKGFINSIHNHRHSLYVRGEQDESVVLVFGRVVNHFYIGDEMTLIKSMVSSKTNEWATPRSLFDYLDKEFNFTLDPCSTIENAKCNKFYTIKDAEI